MAKMKRYEFLNHTADIKFRSYGNNLECAFENSMHALKKIISKKKVGSDISKKISIKAKDYETLLHDLLEELVIVFEKERFLLNKIETLRISDKKPYKLTCKIFGDRVEEKDMDHQIKAITFNEMKINNIKGKHVIEVVVDV